MKVLLFLGVLITIALLFTVVEAWLDRRLIRRTLRQQGGEVKVIKRQWISEVPVASHSRTYHVRYRSLAGNLHSRTCQIFGLILWRELIWLNPLEDYRLIPKQNRREK